MNIRSTSILTAASFLGMGCLQADWTLLSSFVSAPEAEGWDLTHIRGGLGHMVHTEDPTDPENMVFYVESGGYGVSDVNTTFASLTLPTPVNPGETATLFWRYYEAGPSNSFHITLSPVEKERDEESGEWVRPNAFGTLETIYRVGQADDLAETSIRDANRFPRLGVGDTPETFVPFVHTSGMWYNMWMVIHNTEDPFDDHFRVYVQGGEFEEPTVLKVEQIDYSTGELTGEYPDFAWFRNGIDEPLVTLVVFTESGFVSNPFGGDVWYIDDIHLAHGDPGAVLTTPPGVGDGDPVTLWHGYVVGAENVVDTGEWMGMVTIYDVESNWAYAHDLQNWIYVGSAEANGGWVHFFK